MLKCFITNNRKYRSQQVLHKFSRPSGITYHHLLSLIAVCDKGGEKNCSEVVLIKDDCSVYSRIATPFNPLFISVCSLGNFAFFVAGEKEIERMSSESETYLGDVEFPLVASNNINALDSAVDGPAETSHITSINDIYSLGNACLFTDNNQMKLFTPTNEHIKWMSAIRHGHEAYGMVSKHLSKNYKDSKRQEVFTTEMRQLI